MGKGTKVWSRKGVICMELGDSDPGGCWQWVGTIGRGGYGHLHMGRKNRLAHRVVYERLIGPIPEGLTLDHLCRNRACCNPRHLEPVTMKENLLRGEGPSAIHARKTHCPQGHEYNQANTRIRPSGARACRACDKERARRRRAAQP